MARYELQGTMTVSARIEIEAENPEAALEFLETCMDSGYYVMDTDKPYLFEHDGAAPVLVVPEPELVGSNCPHCGTIIGMFDFDGTPNPDGGYYLCGTIGCTFNGTNDPRSE